MPLSARDRRPVLQPGCVSLCPSLNVSVRQSICLSLFCFCLCVTLPTCLSVCPHVYATSLCLSVSMPPVCVSLCLCYQSVSLYSVSSSPLPWTLCVARPLNAFVNRNQVCFCRHSKEVHSKIGSTTTSFLWQNK